MHRDNLVCQARGALRRWNTAVCTRLATGSGHADGLYGRVRAACWLGLRYTEFTLQSRFLVQLSVFIGLIVGATALYLALAWIFRCREIEEVYGIALRRTRSGAEYVET